MSTSLAINGGTPVRKDFIPISKPLIGEDEIKAATEVLRSGMLAQGKQVALFEEEFASYLGVSASQCIAVNSGTAALVIALDALGVQPGDEIITSPFTFVASANAILAVGAVPRFVDVRPDSYNLDEAQVATVVTKRTRGIIPVHLYGLPCEMTPLTEIAEKHGLFVLEDAAQAHGAKYRGERAGTIGDAGIFSFYPTKNMTTTEGGLIVCKDANTAMRSRSLRDQGQKIVDGKVVRYHHSLVGYNWRMTDVAASIGRVQLGKLDGFNAARRRNADIISRALREIPGLAPPRIPSHCETVYHLYGARFDSETLGWSHDKFLQAVQKEGVGIRCPYPIPLYRQEVYQQLNDPSINRWAKYVKYPDFRQTRCPITEMLTTGIIEIPNHQSLTEDDMQDVVNALRKVADAKSK